MTIDSLLTIIGILIAIYAIKPRSDKYDIKLRFRKRDWIIIVVSLILVHYLLFFDFFNKKNLSPNFGFHRWGIYPEDMAYFVILLTFLVIWIDIQSFKLKRGKICRFKELYFSIIWDENFSDLISLLEKHIENIRKIAKNDYFLIRIKKKYTPTPFFINKPRSTEKKNKFSINIMKYLAKLIPEHNKEKEAAQEILNSLLTTERIIQYVAQNRPYFGIELLKYSTYKLGEFRDIYFTYLLNDPFSIWYSEIKNNQNLERGHKYDIPKENKLIHFLLSDANVAKNLAVYQSIGEYIKNKLDALARSDNNDSYNYSIDDFDEVGRYRSPIWTGIFFFDIMVSSALHQDIRDHMWLFYYPHFVGRIIRNMDFDTDMLLEPSRSLPNRYSYLLSEIFSNLRYWIKEVKEIDINQSNVVMRKINISHENGNIPKSSIIAIGRCLWHVINSELPERLKSYYLDIVLSTYYDLRELNATEKYAKVLALSIAKGGNLYWRESNVGQYINQLIKFMDRELLYAHIDQINYLKDLRGVIISNR